MLPTLLTALALSLGQTPPSQPAANAPRLGCSTTAPVEDGAPPAKEKAPESRPFAATKDFASPSCNDCYGQPRRGFVGRLVQAYRDDCKPKSENGDGDNENGDKANGDKANGDKANGDKSNGDKSNGDKTNGDKDSGDKEPKRRALPAPLASPPFPTAEWQGFPLIGVPPSDSVYPLMKAIYGGPCGDAIKDSGVKLYGWVNGSQNWTNCRASNTPSSYWVAPNRLELDQAVLRLEREVNTVQTDHIDWGFRITGDYGIDYRYFTAGGWFSDQLLVHNRLYGADPTEVFTNIYCPGIGRGMILTIGRWIATPDIETQFSPDNYMGTHSLQFTVDVYTETGVMATVMLNEQWTVQAALHAGADMAPWYDGAMPTGMFGVRWVSKDNCDSVYTVLNAINNAKFRYFDVEGVPAGHHNYNIIQSTWQHKFNDCVHTKTEAYLMWERDAAVGGTPSIGPFQFNSGGGLGATVPGTSLTYGVLNYTAFKLTNKDFFVVRNEWMKDENGTRYGFAGNYSSHSIGLTHNFSPNFQVRPEIGYYRNWNTPAFDNGARKDMFLVGFDFTWRF